MTVEYSTMMLVSDRIMSLAYTSAEVLFGGFLWKEVIGLEDEEVRSLLECSQCRSPLMENSMRVGVGRGGTLRSPVPATRRRKIEI